ncbi:MAG: tetratricopeptide repeat protein, partial [Candidatus Cloacimonadaceae bacterium]
NLNAILREALNYFPEDAALLNWLGYNYIQKEYNLAEAEVMILRALQLSPQNPFFLDSIAWLHFLKKDYQKALELMQIPAEMQDMPSEIAYHLARIHIALKNYEDAIPYLNRAIEANDDPEYVKQAQDALRQYYKQ